MLNIPLYRLDADNPQARACFSCGMRGVALFGVLGDRELDQIHTHIVHVQKAAGEPLYEAGDAGESVYTLRSGIG